MWRVISNAVRQGHSGVLDRSCGERCPRSRWSAFDFLLLERLTATSTYPFVVGIDFAGVIEHVPTGERELRPGDRVFGMARTHGAYAAYTAVAPGVQTEPLARIPDGVTDQQVAALPVAGITALGALQLLGAAADQRLVIMGATGGVGGYAVQMAHARGAHVIATVRGDADEARRLGAEEVYDAKAGEVIDALRASHPDGVDAILDLVNRTQSAVTQRFSNAPAASSRRFMRRTKGGSPSAKSRRTTSRPARILL